MRLWRVPVGVRYGFLPAERGGTGLVPWLIGVMAFLAALALVVGITVGGAARDLSRELGTGATVQIVDADAVRAQAAAATALSHLRKDPSVIAARLVPRAETARMLEPWLDDTLRNTDLPLPPAIELRLAPRVDVVALRDRLTARSPSARLDVHADWLSSVTRFLGGLQTLSAIILVLVAVATASVVALGVRSGLDVFRPTIDILHMIGAEDSDLALVFQHRYFQHGIIGGTGGAVCAAIVILAVAASVAPVGLPSALAASGAVWPALALLPPAIGVLAMLAARVSVLRVLRRQP